MAVTRSDLDRAVAEGIVSPEQAEQLRQLASRDSNSDESPVDFSQDPRDEPFRFARGFRDVFVALGLLILAVGLSAIEISLVVMALGEYYEGGSYPFDKAIFALVIAVVLCLAALAMAAFITDKQRLPLSSMVLAAAFAAWTSIVSWFIATSAIAAPEKLYNFDVIFFQSPYAFSAWLGAAIGSFLFYLLFRFPFALFLAGLSTIGIFWRGSILILSPYWAYLYESVIYGLAGLAIFGLAMWFDIRDRFRETRLAECAFWLHLLAAPMLLHAVFGRTGWEELSIAPVGAVMVAISVIALLIDRRALLVSGLAYFGISIWHVVSAGIDSVGNQFILTTVVLGGFVLILGLGWSRLRRIVLKCVPSEAITLRVPPVSN